MKINSQIVFLLASILLLAACQSSPPVAPTITPRPTAAGPQLLDFPRGVCCDGTALEPGTYQLPRWFSPTVSVEIPDDGWSVVRENSIETIYLIRGETPDAEATQLFAFFALDPDQPVEQFQEAVLGSPQITLLGDPRRPSRQPWGIDAQALPNPDEAGNPDADIRPGTQRIALFENISLQPFTSGTPSPPRRAFASIRSTMAIKTWSSISRRQPTPSMPSSRRHKISWQQ